MRITSALVISAVAVAIGVWLRGPMLWFPVSSLLASIVELLTRRWVASDRYGTALALSATLKLFFALIGFYAVFGQLVCVALVAFWLASAA